MQGCVMHGAQGCAAIAVGHGPVDVAIVAVGHTAAAISRTHNGATTLGIPVRLRDCGRVNFRRPVQPVLEIPVLPAHENGAEHESQ